MTSQRRLDANRRNAQKSTGPRTPAGKAVVALNAMKHGIFSGETLLAHDSEAEFLAFAKRLRAQLAPVGEMELLLADRIVSTAWRLRRAIVMETGLMAAKADLAGFLDSGFERHKWQLVTRYETTLERSLFRTLHELQRLQAAREGRAVPLPEAVDVDIAMDGAADGAPGRLGFVPQE